MKFDIIFGDDKDASEEECRSTCSMRLAEADELSIRNASKRGPKIFHGGSPHRRPRRYGDDHNTRASHEYANI